MIEEVRDRILEALFARWADYIRHSQTQREPTFITATLIVDEVIEQIIKEKQENEKKP